MANNSTKEQTQPDYSDKKVLTGKQTLQDIEAQVKAIQAKIPTIAAGVQSLTQEPMGDFQMPDIKPDTPDISHATSRVEAARAEQIAAEQQRKEAQEAFEKEQKAQKEQTEKFYEKLPILGKFLKGEEEAPSIAKQRAEQFEKLGISPTEYFAGQTAAIAELDKLSQDYNVAVAQKDAQITAMMGRTGVSMGFTNRAVNNIERNASVKLNQMSANIKAKTAIMEMKRGNFNEARDFVREAVNDYVADMKFEYQLFQDFTEMNQDKIDRLDIKMQNAIKDATNAAKERWQIEEQQQTDVGNLMLQYPNAGINIGDSRKEAIEKASKITPTPERPQIIAGTEGQYQQVYNPQTGQWEIQPTGITPVTPTGMAAIPGATITPDQLSPVARMVYEGTYKLSDVTPTMKAQIAGELQAVGFTYTMAAENRQQISLIKEGMKDVMDTWKKVPNKWKGLIQGRFGQWIGGKINPAVRQFEAAKGIIGMQLTRLFEKGRISDWDREFYMSLMPDLLTQDLETAQAGANELIRLLEEKMTSQLDELQTGNISPSSSAQQYLESMGY